jgi:hypothetical protein
MNKFGLKAKIIIIIIKHANFQLSRIFSWWRALNNLDQLHLALMLSKKD